MIKIKRILDDKVLVAWKDFESETKVGSIIIPVYRARNVGENRGIIRMIGQRVTKVSVGDYIMFAVGTMYEPLKTDHGKEIIIPEDDIIMIMEESLNLNTFNVNDNENICTNSGCNYAIMENIKDILSATETPNVKIK